MMSFEVKRRDGAYWVLGDGEIVAGPFTNKWWAEERQETLERKAKMKMRKCMTCEVQFMSEGAHHRMCTLCRTRGASAQDVAV